jgi:hypothetical protein
MGCRSYLHKIEVLEICVSLHGKFLSQGTWCSEAHCMAVWRPYVWAEFGPTTLTARSFPTLLQALLPSSYPISLKIRYILS